MGRPEWEASSGASSSQWKTQNPLGSVLDLVPARPSELGSAAARVDAAELDIPFLPRHQLKRSAQGRRGLAGVELYDSKGSILGQQPEWGPQTPLQDVEFGCPWPVRATNPHLDAIRSRALAWMESFGLVTDPDVNADRYTRWMLAESVAWWHPDASAERLQIAADYVGWVFTPFDDVFDGPTGRSPEATGQICQAQAAVLGAPDTPVPRDAPPRVHAFADLWRRSRQGRSPWWRQRAEQHWREYFAARSKIG